MSASIEPVLVSLRMGRPPPKESRSEMPTSGPLVDRYGRIHTDLRISITDRCNFRCTYCLPEEGVAFLARSEILSIEEIHQVAEAAHALGVISVRITGGEPLIRRDVVDVVAGISAVGFEDVALTTNGTDLVRLAPRLAEVGLQRVNISCDSLRANRFAAIRRRGRLQSVLEAMDAAEAARLTPVKVNVVLVRGVNDDEILDFARFGRDTGRIVRFIEFMPLDGEGSWRRDEVVSGAEVLATIAREFPLKASDDFGDPAPATRFAFADGRGEIGVISSVTEPFCGTCDRLRLTAEGAVRNCLFSDDELSVREVLRSGGGIDELALVLRRAVWGKLPGHGINDPGFLRPRRSMSMIGG